MRTVLYRYQGAYRFRPVNGGEQVIIEPSEPDPTPPDFPDSSELGTVGNRPPLSERPDASNTGPRQSMTQTLSASAALAAIMSAPVEADGFRYLRRTHVTGQLTLDNPSYHNLRFEDCLFTNSGSYVINAFFSASDSSGHPDGDWPEFRFCEIRGGLASSVVGGFIRLLRCNIHRGVDITKPRSRSEYYACWMHDTWHDTDSHCDIVQIVSGANGCLFHWNNMIGLNAPESPSGGGGYASGVLQTGSVSRDIGPVEWHNNWFDGGGYTIRVGSSADRNGHNVDYTFTGNRFGRNYRFGPLYGNFNDINFDSSNVWDDTDLPVAD